MNATTDDIPPTQPRRRTHGRFELALASALLALGLFVLPAVIYGVGTALLGPYGENQGMGAFYAGFFRDLAEPSGRTWAIAVGPLVLISAVRLLWLRTGNIDEDTPPPADVAVHKPRVVKNTERDRIEPSVGVD